MTTPDVNTARWQVGPAKYPNQRGRFPGFEDPSTTRGVWTVSGVWVCDCTDYGTALDMAMGHNQLRRIELYHGHVGGDQSAPLREAWDAASPGLLFDVAFGCLARSPIKKKVSVHDFRELMTDVQDTISAMGYSLGRTPETQTAEWRQRIRREIAAIAERFGRKYAREAELTVALFGLLDAICEPVAAPNLTSSPMETDPHALP